MEQYEQDNIFNHLHHTNDPVASKVSASKVKRFKETHESIIRSLVKAHPDLTAKELAEVSQGRLTHIQIDRRIAKMPDVRRNEGVTREGCHPLYYIDLIGA